MTAETVPVDKSNDRIERMFASIAHRYDLMNHLLSLNIDKYWRRRTVRLVPPASSGPILDVCTGTGDLALAYVQEWRRRNGGQLPRDARVVASDFCQSMLEIARSKQRRAGVDPRQLEFLPADTQCLPFEDDTFQIVSVAFGLRNVADTQRGLREMVRVCRPGGRVAVLEFSLPERQPWKSIYEGYFRYVLPKVGQWVARNDHGAYEYLPSSVSQFPSGPLFLQEMHAAGLERTQRYPMTLGIATLYVGEKPSDEARPATAEKARRQPAPAERRDRPQATGAI